MGKLTIILQSSGESTTEMWKKVTEFFQSSHDYGEGTLLDMYETFIVPADEEWPDLG